MVSGVPATIPSKYYSLESEYYSSRVEVLFIRVKILFIRVKVLFIQNTIHPKVTLFESYKRPSFSSMHRVLREYTCMRFSSWDMHVTFSFFLRHACNSFSWTSSFLLEPTFKHSTYVAYVVIHLKCSGLINKWKKREYIKADEGYMHYLSLNNLT